MKISSTAQRFLLFSAVNLLLIMFSIHFLDAALALYIKQCLHSYPFLKKTFLNIPNLLSVAVPLGTTALWYLFFIVRHNVSAMHTDFLRLAGISVPAAYGIKMYLQYFFGRTNIRTWLSGGGTLDFVWFTPLSQHPCFPSGHMTVVTSFVTAVWIYYPRWRLFSGVALISLAAALLLTNYHFLGDVIAGFYCGMCVTLIVRNILSYLHRDIQHTNFTD